MYQLLHLPIPGYEFKLDWKVKAVELEEQLKKKVMELEEQLNKKIELPAQDDESKKFVATHAIGFLITNKITPKEGLYPEYYEKDR